MRPVTATPELLELDDELLDDEELLEDELLELEDELEELLELLEDELLEDSP